MFPSQPVSLSLWGVPSSEAKDAFLSSHTSTRKKRYFNCNNIYTRDYYLIAEEEKEVFVYIDLILFYYLFVVVVSLL